MFPRPRPPRAQIYPHRNSRSSNARRRSRTSSSFAYQTRDWTPERDPPHRGLYEGYALQRSNLPARSRTRPGSCSRPPWPRSPLPAPPTGRICRHACSPPASCRTRSSKASSMPAKRMPAISPVPTPSTKPTTSSRPHRTMPRTPCVSGAAGFSATAPAPARAARSPRSFSTTGSRAADARSGSPNPTN